MAKYNVRLYSNTGFNGVNIPDSPAQLNKCTFTDVDPVYVLQDRALDHVDINATWDTVESVDYVKVGNWFYSVPANGVTMLSEKTARLTLLSDPITSAGGFNVESNGTVSARFDILDGVTQRCTVDSDYWGEYTNTDPLIVPQEPLELQTEWLTPTGGYSKDIIALESTVELPLQATPSHSDGYSYTDEETGETVVVPSTAQLPQVVNSAGEMEIQHTDFIIDGSTVSNGTEVYIRNDTHASEGSPLSAGGSIEAGLQVIHSLGQENGSILNQWRVPKEFLGGVDISYMGIDGEASDTGEVPTIGTDPHTKSITGISATMSSTISPDYKAVKNKRLLYGEYNKYGMITCAGDSAEFKPEDLEGGVEQAPSISYKSDPRPKGKPYYRFTTINSDTDFWRNALAGSVWENVPLVYQGASGSALTRLNFDNERQIKSLQKQQYEDTYALRQAQTLANSAGQFATTATESALTNPAGGVAGGAMAGISAVSGAITGMVGNKVAMDQYEDMYKAQKANELSGLYQSTDIYAPTVNFPYNADILRDVKHNGVLIYKYRMSDNDIARCDKLLTMYGYQTSEQLTLSNFGRRKHFDYVACSTVSVTNLPKWWCDEIATQLKVGVRIWHELPDSSAYDDNPIRS